MTTRAGTMSKYMMGSMNWNRRGSVTSYFGSVEVYYSIGTLSEILALYSQ